jgi:RNA polymerase-binding transcription factor DksA
MKSPHCTSKQTGPTSSPRAVVRPASPSTPNSDGAESIPPEWTWHYRTLLHLRHRLQRVYAAHSDAAVAPAEADGLDRTDNAHERAERDLMWAVLGAERDKLFEIDCALERIRTGTYGYCEETGRPIPPERLRAIPWARYCRTVAEAHESSDSSGR